MSSLTDVRTFGINVASSLATRFIISNYDRLPKNQALVFNGVDMTVNAVTSYLFSKFRDRIIPTPPSDAEFIIGLFVSRAISVISAIIITSQTVGHMHIGTAIRLNVTACAIGLIWRLVEDKQCGDVELVLFT